MFAGRNNRGDASSTVGRRPLLAAVGVAGCAVLLACGIAYVGGSGSGHVRAAGANIAAVPERASAYVPGELIVGLSASGGADGGAREQIEAGGYTVAEVLTSGQDNGDAGSMLLVATAAEKGQGPDLRAAEEDIAAVPGVEFVQPNYRYANASIEAAGIVDDADVSKQYYLNGPEEHGANIAAAWKKLEGAGVGSSAKVQVAVLDTGVYTMRAGTPADVYSKESIDPLYLHQEFGESNLDTAHAKDFVHSDEGGDPLPLVNANSPDGDDNGHGTHVAAIIGAGASTGSASGTLPVGVAGVSQNARVVPVKVLDANGEGSTADFIRAYEYLLNSGLDNLHVVNMSLAETDEGDTDGGADEDSADEGEDGEDLSGVEDDAPDEYEVEAKPQTEAADNEALHQVIREAYGQGIITVCAAGNDGSTNPTFPSDYEECVSVTALDDSGGNAAYSNYSADKDISAPGTNVYSAWASQADSYATMTGTSQATAVVSGVLAMLWAADPGLSAETAKAAIYGTARPVTGKTQQISPDANGAYNGSHGAIDAAAAVDYVLAAKNGNAPKSLADKACGVVLADEQADPDPAEEPAVTVTYDGHELTQGADYTTTYLHAPSKGGGTAVLVDGTGDYTGWTALRIAPEKQDIAAGAAKLGKDTYTYTGKELKPTVRLNVGGEKLQEGADFSVAYKNNKNPGKARVTITGQGVYTGTKTLTFKIALGKTAVKKLAAGKKRINVTWKRQKNGKVGYEVRYSPKKNMKNARQRRVAGNAKTAVALKHLKTGTRYYVQVRTYKKLGGTTYRSSWSPKKSVRVK